MDSRRIAEGYLAWARERLTELGPPPCIATVLMRGKTDAGSRKYRDLILSDAKKLGVRSRSVEARDEAELIDAIKELNADESVSGIVVLYPLGLDFPDDQVMDLVSPEKDIEGLHSINLGYLIKFRRYLDRTQTTKCVVPATAKAVVKGLMAYPDVRIEGAFVTIVNNSMRVGKPLGLMLENLGATVVKCYEKTCPEDLEACIRRSDIVVTAVPDPSFRLNPSWIREGAAVIDVSFQGNCDTTSLEGRASLVSDAGNRIGKITRAMMFVNLIYCARPAKVAEKV